VAVARALARLTGDSAEAVPVLLGVPAELKLAELGPLLAEAAPVLRRILATDERLTSGGDFAREREFRQDVARALANCA
jgi:hypothetical protein